MEANIFKTLEGVFLLLFKQVKLFRKYYWWYTCFSGRNGKTDVYFLESPAYLVLLFSFDLLLLVPPDFLLPKIAAKRSWR